jgi:hypothetical protein
MMMLRRLDVSGLFALSILLLLIPGASEAQQRPAIVEKLADTYGLPSFGQVDAIRYTFNAQFPGVQISRSWIWEPKTDQVTYAGKDKSGKPVKVTYLRSKIDAQSADIEPNFVNDEYWLLLPFHFAQDGSATVEDAGVQPLPSGKGTAEKLVMKYPPQGGGTSPGDTWDLYIGGNGRIEVMVFHRGGPRKPSLVVADWTKYKKAGPLLFSLDHPGTADGKPLHVFFSNVAVKLTGSNTWLKSQ